MSAFSRPFQYVSRGLKGLYCPHACQYCIYIDGKPFNRRLEGLCEVTGVMSIMLEDCEATPDIYLHLYTLKLVYFQLDFE